MMELISPLLTSFNLHSLANYESWGECMSPRNHLASEVVFRDSRRKWLTHNITFSLPRPQS